MVAITEPRIHFNWGYHDGAADQRNHVKAVWISNSKPHFNPSYEAGYWSGVRDMESGRYEGDSTEAWASMQSAKKAMLAARKAAIHFN